MSLDGAKFFINQNSEVNFLRENNKSLITIDSLCNSELSNCMIIVDSCNSIISYKDSIISNSNNAINELLINNNELAAQNEKQKNEIRFKNHTIITSILVIIFESFLIIKTL